MGLWTPVACFKKRSMWAFWASLAGPTCDTLSVVSLRLFSFLFEYNHEERITKSMLIIVKKDCSCCKCAEVLNWDVEDDGCMAALVAYVMLERAQRSL